jgi:hypothetical protein
MVNKTMGSAMVTPIPLKAPMEPHTEGGGGFSFILHPVCLFLYYTQSDYSTRNRFNAILIRRMQAPYCHTPTLSDRLKRGNAGRHAPCQGEKEYRMPVSREVNE